MSEVKKRYWEDRLPTTRRNTEIARELLDKLFSIKKKHADEVRGLVEERGLLSRRIKNLEAFITSCYHKQIEVDEFDRALIDIEQDPVFVNLHREFGVGLEQLVSVGAQNTFRVEHPLSFILRNRKRHGRQGRYDNDELSLSGCFPRFCS